ncbi:hypothetical protein LTR36_003053 [Oleoguttula mirabilis]|uniref:Uncharacterized protein n=1 Tax=Oleoguttula mirabilis TaxID=1507867 RepID=A0AAV9JY52_9PEZI|nr:hypothetical protein LTR36_003053 [Oleoguttula mirabilis]
MDPIPNPQPHLLTIARELRDQIYDYTTNDVEISRRRGRRSPPSPANPSPSSRPPPPRPSCASAANSPPSTASASCRTPGCCSSLEESSLFAMRELALRAGVPRAASRSASAGPTS